MYCLHLGSTGISVYLGEQRVWLSEDGIGLCMCVQHFAILKDAVDFVSYHKDYPLDLRSIWIRELFLAKKSLKNIV